MGKKLIFKRIRGRIIPILQSGNVSRPVSGVKDAGEVMANVESIRKKRELMRAGDYSRIDKKRGFLVGGHEYGSWFASGRIKDALKKLRKKK